MPILLSEISQLWQDVLKNGELMYSPFILSIFVILLFLKVFKNGCNLHLPPSPPKLPVIGNLHQMIGKFPHRSLHALSQKHGPLMLLHLGQAPTLVVSSAEIIDEILKDHDIAFSNRPSITAAKVLFYGCADFGFAPYGEYWKKARKICVSELLSNKRVESFQFVREEEVALLVEKVHQASSMVSSVNLSEMLLATLHSIISRCIIGQKAKEKDGKFGELSKRFVSHMWDFSFGDLFPGLGWLDVVSGLIGRMKATFKEMDAFLDSVIMEGQKSLENDPNRKEKDLVQIFLHLQKDGMQGGLSLENFKAILLDMFVAAVESSALTIERAMAELVKNPKIMKKAQEEVRRVVREKGSLDEDEISQMEYLKCIIKETLRLHPPGPLMPPREISTRIKLRGYDILPKTRVLVNVWAIQRDPKFWDRPEEFIPERFENNPIDFRGQDSEFIPFGVGRRGCPGISFGVAALELVIANLLYWFDWKLPGNVDCRSLTINEAFGIDAYKQCPLLLVPNAHSP